jgi:hypothetical protein
MTWCSRILKVTKGGAASSQKHSSAHIGMRTMRSILYRFFRFEISVRPSYSLNENFSPESRVRRRLCAALSYSV